MIFKHLGPGTPILFKTGGLKGAPPTLYGVVDEVLTENFALCVKDESGSFWLVLPDEFIEACSIH